MTHSHAIQFFDMSSLVRMEDAHFDDLERLEANLPLLSKDEQKLVACVHLLAMLLDGTHSVSPLRLRCTVASACYSYVGSWFVQWVVSDCDLIWPLTMQVDEIKTFEAIYDGDASTTVGGKNQASGTGSTGSTATLSNSLIEGGGESDNFRRTAGGGEQRLSRGHCSPAQLYHSPPPRAAARRGVLDLTRSLTHRTAQRSI